MDGKLDLSSLSLAEKRELLARLIKEKKEDSRSPLSFGQERIWMQQQLLADSLSHVLVGAVRVLSKQPVPIDRVRLVLNRIVARHDILRTTFEFDGNQLWQKVHDSLEFLMEEIDLRNLTSREKERRMAESVHEDLRKPFELSKLPLFRVKIFRLGEHDQILTVGVHHIIFDGASIEIWGSELQGIFRTSEIAPLPRLPIQYHEFARRQRLELTEERLKPELDYWSTKLHGLPALHLPSDYPRPSVRTFRGDHHRFEIPEMLLSRLEQVSQELGITPFVVWLTAFKTWLHLYSDQTDFAVRTQINDRDKPEYEQLIGYLTNTLVIRGLVTGEEPFQDLLQQVHKTYLEALEHKALPFEFLLKKAGRRRLDPSLPPFAQVGIIHLSGRHSTFSNAELSLELLELGAGISLLDLTLYVGTGEANQAAIEFNTALFRPSTIESLAQNFVTFLQGILFEPTRPVSQISLITSEDQSLITSSWTGPSTDLPFLPVHQLFEEVVEKQSDWPAVESEAEAIDFQQLNRRANRLAHFLRSRGVGPDIPVALLLPPSIDLVVAQLAVLKAGGAYLSVEPFLPVERIRWTLEDCGPHCLITTRRGGTPEFTHPGTAFVLEEIEEALLEQSDSNLDWNGSADSLAYLIYTSGSSGHPKGVMVPHRALSNHMNWICREFDFGKGRVLQRTPNSFDACVWEFFAPLVSGGVLVIAPPSARLDMKALAETVRDCRITHLQLVPSLLHLLLEREALADCPALEILFSGGEALTSNLQEAFFQQSSAQLVNLYGPAEACIDATFHRCQADQADRHAPLGRPIDNLQLWILSANGKILPVGFPGELCISGEGLARGYWKRPEETEKSFIDHPYQSRKRLYRTGDRVRIDSQGCLQFLGRLDHQIKLSGVRIEPAEVEAALESHAAIRHSVVATQESGSGKKQLVAYYTAEKPLSTGELRKFLQLRLPRFMVPSRFQHLHKVPTNASGKVDYPALLEFQPESGPDGTPRVEPRNQTEELLQRIWQDVLDLDEIGVHDDFFDLGGGSLQVIRLVSQAEGEGISINPGLVFAYPTIAELAELIVDGEASGAASTPQIPLEELASIPELLPLRYLHRDRAPQTRASTVIESLGVYLPPNEVSTDAVLNACRKRPRLALEKLTGIETRRMAGKEEFAIDLARQAIQSCLASSRWEASDIDLLLSCSISRCDAPVSISYEPSTAIRLKGELGLERAITFDLTNACAGFFTGIHLADQFIQAGLVERVLIVSGEYITHLTRTAQQEISDFLDSRLACLTLGDAGAAVILEKSTTGQEGFHSLDLLTLSRYCSLCVAQATDQPHGGAIMHTDMVEVSATATRHSMIHAALLLNETGWTLEDFDHLLAHQTSRSALRGATREISRILGRETPIEINMLDNLSQRGNTASTSHAVALWDGIHRGEIQNGNTLLFSISGSGQTIGSAIYRLDDLPSRVRGGHHAETPKLSKAKRSPGRFLEFPEGNRLRIESVGFVGDGKDFRRDAIYLAEQAGKACLQKSRHPRTEIGTVIHCGVYRNDFMAEPALATFVANRLDINPEIRVPEMRTSLAFDIFNGSVGVLDAIATAGAKTLLDPQHLTLITASEIENNAGLDMPLLGLREAGSALLLDRSEDGHTGFGRFLFRDFPEYLGDFTTAATSADGKSFLQVQRSDDFIRHVLEAVQQTVKQLFEDESGTPDEIDIVFPPLLDSHFSQELSRRLAIPHDKFAVAPSGSGDLSTSSLACGFEQLGHSDERKGQVGMVIAASPGIQVGCALYFF